MKYFKFVTWEAAPIEAVLTDKIPQTLKEFDNGNAKPFNDMQIATTTPFYKRGGWCFDLRDYLKKYWAKTKHYGICEYYAVNKTAIRKELKTECLQIVEICK